jgi:hypothetical protein
MLRKIYNIGSFPAVTNSIENGFVGKLSYASTDRDVTAWQQRPFLPESQNHFSFPNHFYFETPLKSVGDSAMAECGVRPSDDSVAAEIPTFLQGSNVTDTGAEHPDTEWSSSSEMPDASKCRVCGGETSQQHNYYGCTGVCVSCRGFFRRSVQSGTSGLFECVGVARGLAPGACLADARPRRSCKRCRFDRCLQLGMKTGWVWTNQERQVAI